MASNAFEALERAALRTDDITADLIRAAMQALQVDAEEESKREDVIRESRNRWRYYAFAEKARADELQDALDGVALAYPRDVEGRPVAPRDMMLDDTDRAPHDVRFCVIGYVITNTPRQPVLVIGKDEGRARAERRHDPALCRHVTPPWDEA